jgi:hypothetical protein
MGLTTNSLTAKESCMKRIFTARPNVVTLQLTSKPNQRILQLFRVLTQSRFGNALISFDPKAEARLRWKIDLYIVPTVGILYLFCFIDRANIGNARLAGFEKDLALKGYDYNTVLSVFYISKITTERLISGAEAKSAQATSCSRSRRTWLASTLDQDGLSLASLWASAS